MGPFSQIQGALTRAHGVTQTVAVPSPRPTPPCAAWLSESADEDEEDGSVSAALLVPGIPLIAQCSVCVCVK